MALIVNSNIAVNHCPAELGNFHSPRLQGSVARLSSGLRITKASDDAAGLGISETFTSANSKY